MRNRWGVEVKKGHWVSGRTSRGDMVQGRVAKIERTGDYARAYGPRVILDNGMSLGVDDISQTLGPMTVEDDGTVRQNPTLRFRDLSIGQRFSFAPSKDGFYRYGRVCVKTSARGYEHADGSGSPMRVGSINVEVVAENPLTRVRIKSPPQRPAGNSEAPSKRLMARRKKTAKAPAGVYANPAKSRKETFPHRVMVLNSRGSYENVAGFMGVKSAAQYLAMLQESHPEKAFMIASD